MSAERHIRRYERRWSRIQSRKAYAALKQHTTRETREEGEQEA